MDRHIGVCCDGCNTQNFAGMRWKCLHCPNYDLCDTCKQSSVTSLQHRIGHPMRPIEPPQACFEQEDENEYNTLDSDDPFACPWCGPCNFDEMELVHHISTSHEGERMMAPCSLCMYYLGDFDRHDVISHFKTRHRRSFGNQKQQTRRDQLFDHALNDLAGSTSDRGSSSQSSRSQEKSRVSQSVLGLREAPSTTLDRGKTSSQSSLLSGAHTPTKRSPSPPADRHTRAAFVRELLLSTLL
eukprot:Colp12_sorted_trinity150504_noHs@9752